MDIFQHSEYPGLKAIFLGWEADDRITRLWEMYPASISYGELAVEGILEIEAVPGNEDALVGFRDFVKSNGYLERFLMVKVDIGKGKLIDYPLLTLDVHKAGVMLCTMFKRSLLDKEKASSERGVTQEYTREEELFFARFPREGA